MLTLSPDSLQDMVFRQGTMSPDWANDVTVRLEAIEQWYRKWVAVAGWSTSYRD